MTIEFRKDDLTGEAVRALLAAHLAETDGHAPAASNHALGAEALRAPGITFWSAWDGDALVGCCALKAVDDTEGEIKSMHTAAAHRRRGVASRMLAHLIGEARRRGYARLTLETGSMAAFAAARALYARHGFVDCPPISGYRQDPYSVFMALDLGK